MHGRAEEALEGSHLRKEMRDPGKLGAGLGSIRIVIILFSYRKAR